MRLIVLKELPDGTAPGAEIDTNPDIANVLILVGAARKRTAQDDRATAATRTAAVDAGTPAPPAKPQPSRSYARRDLQAEKGGE